MNMVWQALHKWVSVPEVRIVWEHERHEGAGSAGALQDAGGLPAVTLPVKVQDVFL